MNPLTQMLRGLGMGRVIVLAGIGVALIAFLLYMTDRMTTPNMGLLYGNLEVSSASEVVAKLESMGVQYRLTGDGTQVLVPADQVLRLRMTLAGDGLPGGGAVGYEIFDNSDSFGTTNLVQQINMVRALEGELSRTIGSLSIVAGARVHLVIPRRELFNRGQGEASASIALKLRGAGRLTRQQIAAIQNLTAAAVPNLSPSRITIIDDKGNLLARGGDDEADASTGAATAEDFRATFESRLKKTIEQLVESSVGPGKVRAEVSAEIDFDRFTTNEELFDPDGQVVRSQQLVEERTDSSDSDTDQSVSASNNLPDSEVSESGMSSSNHSARTEETINYEVSRTVRTHVREGGSVQRLSIAVLVDGFYNTDAEGERVYEPRSEEELAQFTQLVKSAVGFNADRGDTVEVVNMRFAEIEAPTEIAEAGGALADIDYMKVLEIVVLGFVAVLVIMLVLRPIVSRLLVAMPQVPLPPHPAVAAQPGAPAAAIAAPEAAPAIPHPEAPPPPPPRRPPPVIEEEEEDSLIDIGRVEGQVKRSQVKKIGEIVEKHPEEALNIVRNWLYQD